MSDQEILVPKLRFPEFRDTGAWEEKLLGEIYSFCPTNSLSRDKLNYKAGSIKNIHYGDIHTKFSTLFDIKHELVPYIAPSQEPKNINPDSYCVVGDIIFADASEDLNDVGKSIEIINLDNGKLISGLHTILARQIETRLVIGFGGYLFKSPNIRKKIQREAQGTKVMGISKGRLENVGVFYPKDKAEQQKTADCLSSIDQLITAEAQKLHGLKAYKKGLMQQLFPREGETQPSLRFPEFRDAGPWEEKRLGDGIQLISGQHLGPNEYTNSKSECPYFTGPSNFTDKESGVKKWISSAVTAKLAKHGDVLVTVKGSGVGELCLLRLSKVAIGRQLMAVRGTEFDSDFLFYLLDRKKNYLASLAMGNMIPGISRDDLLSLTSAFPVEVEEQQKIADCLSSIDQLITAGAKKLDRLKAHKKGLMQQLFPASDEVSG